MKRYGSRKFVAMCIQCAAVVLLPVIYKKLEISETVLLTVIGSTTALTAGYFGANVLDSKNG